MIETKRVRNHLIRQCVEQHADGQVIRQKESEMYWKLAAVSKSQLKLELHHSDIVENKDISMFTFDCKPYKMQIQRMKKEQAGNIMPKNKSQ